MDSIFYKKFIENVHKPSYQKEYQKVYKLVDNYIKFYKMVRFNYPNLASDDIFILFFKPYIADHDFEFHTNYIIPPDKHKLDEESDSTNL